jgi:hypothetical protein
MPDDITTDLAAIGAALDAGPTPGEWMHLPGDRFVYDRMEDGCRGIPVVGVDYQPSFFDRNGRTLDYVAACHPARMARILADHARLTAGLNTASRQLGEWAEAMGKTVDERDSLRSELVNQTAAAEMARGALVLCQTARDRLDAGLNTASRQLGEWAEAMGKTVDERDRLAAAVQALRAELGVYTGQGPSHVYQGLCPDPQQPESIDAECPACRLIDAARTAKEG